MRPGTSTSQQLGTGSTYPRSIFEAILEGLGKNSSSRGSFDCREDGVWITDAKSLDPDPDPKLQREVERELCWHPLGELTESDGPNLLEEPWLRFPFTARHLAAFMIHGRGYSIREKYGAWEDGPSPDALLDLPVRGAKAAEVLAAAYEAYRQAVSLAPVLDRGLEKTAQELGRAYDLARDQAMQREELQEAGISGAEYTLRIARVNKIVGDLSSLASEARSAADGAYEAWRRAVIQHLLLPVDQVPAAATRPDYSLLATRDELFAAFGGFGLRMEWFKDLKSRQWLYEAREVVGQGQRGRVQEPRFCPLKVMTGLIEKSRTSQLKRAAGWRILKNRFPAVYAASAVGDPNDDPE